MNPPINQNTNPTNQAQYRQVNTPQLLFFLTHKIIRSTDVLFFHIYILLYYLQNPRASLRLVKFPGTNIITSLTFAQTGLANTIHVYDKQKTTRIITNTSIKYKNEVVFYVWFSTHAKT